MLQAIRGQVVNVQPAREEARLERVGRKVRGDIGSKAKLVNARIGSELRSEAHAERIVGDQLCPARTSAQAIVDFPIPFEPRKAIAVPPIVTALA